MGYEYEEEDGTPQELMKIFNLFTLEIPEGVEDFSILMMVIGIGVHENLY